VVVASHALTQCEHCVRPDVNAQGGGQLRATLSVGQAQLDEDMHLLHATMLSS
jgi:hypothetical protein